MSDISQISVGGTLYDINGGGHEMSPTPSAGLTDAQIVAAVNTPQSGANEQVPSVYTIQRWSNGQTKRFIIKNTGALDDPIGSTGIGTYDLEADTTEVTPVGSEDPSSEGWYEVNTTTHLYQLTADTEVVTGKKYFSSVIADATLSTWQYISELEGIDIDDSDEIEISLKYDPSINEPIYKGGYILDTDTGRICIKFANEVSDTALPKTKIAIDVTYLRNEIS